MKSGSGHPNNVIYKEVVVIGNGPSGIALSYMLSGNLPFLISDSHPDEMLSMRLTPCVKQCLVKQDLSHLAAGLEGRSMNPVSLLLDSLLHPCADIGLEMAPLVEFRKVGVQIDHVVLGKGPPGGSWHKMDPYILTLSLGAWMALPELAFNCRDSGEKRAFACNVANYYVQYVKEMELEPYFINNVHVTHVTPLYNPERKISCSSSIEPQERDFTERLNEINVVVEEEESKNKEIQTSNKNCAITNALNYILSRGSRKLKPSRCSKRPREQNLCQGQSPDRKIRESNNLKRVDSSSCDSINTCDKSSNSSSYLKPMTNSHSNPFANNRKNPPASSSSRVPFRINVNPICDPDKRSNWLVETDNVESGERTTYSCKYLVLANGFSDIPNRLDFATNTEDPDWLFHDLRIFENHLDDYMKDKNSEDVDPVVIVGAGLSAADAVIAARGRNVPVLHVFRNKSADLNRQLPENMYPEYHKVHQMMQDGGSLYPFYSAYPEYSLSDIDESSHSVILTSKSGDSLKIRVSFAAVLIGSRPDLGFLPQEIVDMVKKEFPTDVKSNTLDIDKLTHCVAGFENLFAVGPLAGDNFVRFIPGGALALVTELYKRNNYYPYVCNI